MANIFYIARTAHLRIITSSFYALLLLVVCAAAYFSQYLTLFEFGKGLNLMREMGSSSIFLWTLLCCLLGTNLVITEEIESRVVYTILSKPVTTLSFLLGKFLGVCSSVCLGVITISVVMFFGYWQKYGVVLLGGYDAWGQMTLWTYMNNVFFKDEILLLAQTLYLSACTAAILASVCVLCFTSFSQNVAFVLVLALSILGLSVHMLFPTGLIIPSLAFFQLPSHTSQGQLVSPNYILGSILYLLSFVTFIISLNAHIFERRSI